MIIVKIRAFEKTRAFEKSRAFEKTIIEINLKIILIIIRNTSSNQPINFMKQQGIP